MPFEKQKQDMAKARMAKLSPEIRKKVATAMAKILSRSRVKSKDKPAPG